MEFAICAARTRTTDLHAEAIRSLRRSASAEARSHFDITDDGSILLDALTLETEPV